MQRTGRKEGEKCWNKEEKNVVLITGNSTSQRYQVTSSTEINVSGAGKTCSTPIRLM